MSNHKYITHIKYSLLLMMCGDVELNPGPKIKYLRMIQLNARSIKTVDKQKNKIIQFRTLVALKKPHVISVCETWLNKKVKTKDILGDNKDYKIHRKDRDAARGGGGVFVAISKQLKSKRRDDLEADTPYYNEMIAIEILRDNGSRVGIVSAYKAPNELNLQFAINLKHVLQGLWDKGIMELVVMGDFNLPEIDWDTGFPKTLNGLAYNVAETFQEFGLIQQNRTPSRLENDNILDIILVNHEHHIQDLDCYRDIVTTDHAIIDFKYTLNYTPPKQELRQVFNMKRANFAQITQDIAETNWSFIEEAEHIDNVLDSWENIVLNIANRHIPKKQVGGDNSYPWVDAEVIHLSNKKETKRRKAKRTGRRRDWDTYKRYNQRLQTLVHNKFNQYVADSTEEMGRNPKKFWALVNSRTGDRGYPQVMKHTDLEVTTDLEKAEAFNTFFGSVFTENDPNAPLPLVDSLENPLLHTIILTEEEVDTALGNLDVSKAAGLDGIPTALLKECRAALKNPLTRIFNRSLREGTVPSNWKKAKVCPVHKKGNKSDITNYRPISLLSVTSKTLERCLYAKVMVHLRPLISHAQHGFVAGRSTTTQLLECYNWIEGEVDKSKQVDSIFLDFSKAFDSVSHPHLMTKLTTFGICGPLLDWFNSYLTNRTQVTTINNSTSAPIPVKSGVLQGSILGPLLFLLFINDMIEALNPSTHTALYADDAKIYRRIDNIQDSTTLQEDLESLVRWSLRWKLIFNAGKCKVIRFSRKINPIRFIYNINGTPLEKLDTIKDLGILVQDNLMWDAHIRGIVSKANQVLYFIKRAIGYHAPVKARTTLYTSLVRSHLEYASIIWAPTTKKNLELIEQVQRRATRYICNFAPLDYKERLIRSKLLPLSYRRELLDCQYAYKARAGVLGTKSHQICSARPTRHNRRLNEGNTHIELRTFNTETFGHFYTNRIPVVWNKLSETARAIPYNPKSSNFKTIIRREYYDRLNTHFNPNLTCTWITKCRCTNCRT
jgi:hypothetical protein